MQFGKVFIDSSSELTEDEFYNLVKGKDIGGIDRNEAYKLWSKSKPKKEKKNIEDKKEEALN